MKNLLLIVLFLSILSCNRNACDDLVVDNEQYFEWRGNDQSRQVLNKVFDYLGGRKYWADLRSVYVEYQQEDENFGKYSSKQFQSLDKPQIILDQQINGVRLVRILNDSIGWVINDGNMEQMDELNKNFMYYWYSLDYYKKLHELAVGKNLEVKFTSQNQLIIFKDEKFYCGFELNKDFIPIAYNRPRFNDQNISLRLLEWNEQDGRKYPAKAESFDHEFEFVVRDIVLSKEDVLKTFNIDFSIDGLSKYYL